MKGRLPNVVNCVCGGRARIHKGEVGFYVRCEFDPGFASAQEYKTPKRAANAWAAAQEQMDRLTRGAVCAYHRRKSYGQYIAGVPVEPPAERLSMKTPEDDRPKCLECGQPILSDSNRRKYCSAVCADIAMDRQRQESKLRRANKNDS